MDVLFDKNIVSSAHSDSSVSNLMFMPNARGSWYRGTCLGLFGPLFLPRPKTLRTTSGLPPSPIWTVWSSLSSSSSSLIAERMWLGAMFFTMFIFAIWPESISSSEVKYCKMAVMKTNALRLSRLATLSIRNFVATREMGKMRPALRDGVDLGSPVYSSAFVISG